MNNDKHQTFQGKLHYEANLKCLWGMDCALDGLTCYDKGKIDVAVISNAQTFPGIQKNAVALRFSASSILNDARMIIADYL